MVVVATFQCVSGPGVMVRRREESKKWAAVLENRLADVVCYKSQRRQLKRLSFCARRLAFCRPGHAAMRAAYQVLAVERTPWLKADSCIKINGALCDQTDHRWGIKSTAERTGTSSPALCCFSAHDVQVRRTFDV